MKINKLLLFALVICLGCGNEITNNGDTPVTSYAEPVPMYDIVSVMGQKVKTNGYNYDLGTLDNAFNETLSCLGLEDIPSDIYIELQQPYSAFPCSPLPESGCGGLFDPNGGDVIITVTADLVRLKHEYIHYMTWYAYGETDAHGSDSFINCS